MASKKPGFEKEPQNVKAHEQSLTNLSPPPVKAVIGEGGRLIIPAEMRRAMGIKPGDTISLRLEEGALKVVSAKQALDTIRKLAKSLKKPGESIVDEFISDRRKEEQRANERFDRLEQEAAETAARQREI